MDIRGKQIGWLFSLSFYIFVEISKSIIAISFIVGGVIEIPSRILVGYVADKWISNTALYAFGMFVPGFMSLLCAIISGLPGKCSL